MVAAPRGDGGGMPRRGVASEWRQGVAKKTTASEADERLVEDSGLFDEAWYVERYKPKFGEGGSALRHFLVEGGPNGLSPSARFVSSAYFALYPDVARNGANPLVHYLKTGKDTGKRAIRRQDLEGLGLANLGRRDQRMIAAVARSGGFDEAYYLETYPDARSSGLHPMLHYVRHGLETLANPSADFDAARYAADNPDLVESGLPPLVHFARSGARQSTADDAEPQAATEAADVSEPSDEIPVAETETGSVAELVDDAPPSAAEPEETPDDVDVDVASEDHDADELGAEQEGSEEPGLDEPELDAPAKADEPAAAEPTEPAAAEAAAPLAPEADAPTPGVDEPADAVPTVDVPKAAPADVRVAAKAGADMPVEEALAALAGTRLFDAAWYVKRYPEVARSGLSPAAHYLQVGGPRRRRPSALFDAEYYVGAGPALPAGANPVLHFLAEGRRDRRPSSPLLDVSDPAGRLPSDAASISEPSRPAAGPAVDWLSAAQAERLPDAVAFAGRPIGQVAAGVSLAPLAAYARLAGLDPVETGVGADGSGDGLFAQAFRSGPARLSDAWFVDAGALRLRFGGFAGFDGSRHVARGYQGSPRDRSALRLCGEILLPAAGPGLLDLALLEPLEPVLLTLSEPGGRIVGFALLPFPSLARGGLHHAELVADGQGQDPVEGLTLASESAFADLVEGPGALARILVDPAGATGAEPIFSDALLGWLDRRFGVAVELDDDEDDVDPIRDHLRRALAPRGRARQGLTLRLPPDAIPSLAALAARRLRGPGAAGASGAFVIAAAPSGEARLLVRPPELDARCLSSQGRSVPLDYPVLFGDGDAEVEGPRPTLAIRRRRFVKAHDASLIRPVAPDAPIRAARTSADFAAILFCAGTTEATRLIESLSRQTGVSDFRVSIRLTNDAADADEISRAAEKAFPGRADVREAEGGFWAEVSAAARETGAPYLLVAKSGVVAPDPSTLAVLLSLAEAGGTASAACVAINEDAAKRVGAIEALSGGYFAAAARAPDETELTLVACDSLQAFPNAVYPVAANVLDFAVLSAEAVAEAPADDESEAAWGLRQTLAGRRNLCVSTIRVARYGEGLERPPSVRVAVSPKERAAVAANATVVREFAS